MVLVDSIPYLLCVVDESQSSGTDIESERERERVIQRDGERKIEVERDSER